VLQYYRTGDLVTAAKTFADANFDMIEDENIQGIISNIRQDMAGNIYQSLVQQGLQLWNGGDKTQAMDYFQASLKIQPDNPEAMFYVGRLYQENGDTENANAMFDKIVGEHGDSEYAQRAATARGY
jgi:Tfp pilus assembly protein PilF